MGHGAEIIESQVICRQPGRYIGWPTIARADDGELFVVFSGDRDAHVDPFGKTCFMRSSDHGATWSDAVVINDTPLDDRDAGICVAPDGSLIVSWFTSHYDDYLACFADFEDGYVGFSDVNGSIPVRCLREVQ